MIDYDEEGFVNKITIKQYYKKLILNFITDEYAVKIVNKEYIKYYNSNKNCFRKKKNLCNQYGDLYGKYKPLFEWPHKVNKTFWIDHTNNEIQSLLTYQYTFSPSIFFIVIVQYIINYITYQYF